MEHINNIAEIIFWVLLVGPPFVLFAEYAWRKEMGCPLPSKYFLLVLLTWWVVYPVGLFLYLRKRKDE